mmetsp:Transcript_21071/g.31975  ORF Transcript_21071/g.31975 Transcript_21071/m.31975 type:complete len:220 (-) Transcript_21071:131-790(-)
MMIVFPIFLIALLPSWGSSFSTVNNYPLLQASTTKTTTALQLQLKQELMPPPDKRGAPQGGDMAYIEKNIARQMDTYANIREVGGLECVRDVYARAAPQEECWFIGKVAFTSGTVTIEAALHRQWNLLQEHASRLRPVELGRAFGRLEIYIAPGDSELLVSKDELPLTLVARPTAPLDEENSKTSAVKLFEVGFHTEVVTDQGVGFRVKRAFNGDVLLP